MLRAQESWVTCVQNDTEALQAWGLAISLKEMHTGKKLTVIVSPKVSAPILFVLRQEFDLVVEQPTLAHALALCGIETGDWDSVDNEDCGRLWAWTLKIWNKCVHLPLTSMPLENCDKLFDYNEFTQFSNLDGVYVFQPNLTTFANLLQMWRPNHAAGSSEKATSFHQVLEEYFGKSENSSKVELDTSSGILSLGHGEAPKMGIQWLSKYPRFILPSVRTYLMQFMENNNLPVGLKLDAQIPNSTFQSLRDDPVLRDSISVVGMSCRFADCNNTDEFWRLLAEGRSGIRSFPPGRPNIYGNVDLTGVKGGYLKCPVDEFDARFFGTSPREAVVIDPQQRLLLEVIWEALEMAGIPPCSLQGSNTASYLGISMQDYKAFILKQEPYTGMYWSRFLHSHLGTAFSAASSRISRFLGLRGPSISVDTGCSSSLSALHLACASLRRGETSLAIASGANLVLGTVRPVPGNASVILSRDYLCRTFDEAADGFVRAEGMGALILKRTADAISDGDSILAIVRGSALNNDGSGTSFGTPNQAAQERVFRQALKEAGVAARDVAHVEAHGTGTAVGDPIEMAAIGSVYSEGRAGNRPPLYVASVKTNVGHTESASGTAGLIKTILALQHRLIPAHLNLRTLNPAIDLDSIPAIIPTKLIQWEAPSTPGVPRLAAVNSFSISGTNAHVILQEPPPFTSAPVSGVVKLPVPPTPQLITLSAKSDRSLQELARQYLAFLSEPGRAQSLSLTDLTYTVNVCRAHNFPHRITLTATDTAEAAACLRERRYDVARVPSRPPRIGFLFTGQGCQYFGMARNLFETSPFFAAAFERCETLFSSLLGVSLADVIWVDAGLLRNTIYCQPAIFAVQYCLLEHWAALGVRPAAVLGHSVGEFAAGVAAGLFTLQQAMKLVVERSRLVNTLPESTMLVVHTGLKQVQQLLTSFEFAADTPNGVWVDVAADNSAAEVVLSGTKETLRALEKFCHQVPVKCQALASSHAFHSRAMDPILGQWEQVVRSVLEERSDAMELNCTYISGTKAQTMGVTELLQPSYWTEHLRRTVRFTDAIQQLGPAHTGVTKGAGPQCDILMEIGPQPILLALAMTNLGGGDGILFAPSMRRPRPAFQLEGCQQGPNDWINMLTTTRRLYMAGVNVEWSRWYKSLRAAGHPLRRLPLPTYPFDRQSYWYTPSEGQTPEVELGSAYSSKERTPQTDVDCKYLNISTEEWIESPWVSGARHDLRAVLQDVTVDSKRTAAKLKECNNLGVGDKAVEGRKQVNRMCFYYIVKCIQECGWPIPALDSSVGWEFWRPQIAACEQLSTTRLHHAFIAALMEEGYLQPQDEGNPKLRMIRPLPTVDECQRYIQDLQAQIPTLLPHDTQLFNFALHCASQLTEVVLGRTSGLTVLFPSDSSAVGAQRFYDESETYTVQSDVFLESIGDLIAPLIHPAPQEPKEPRVLRILEVGAGTGATTGRLIKLLQSAGVRYHYTFTDLSPRFLDKAREKFGPGCGSNMVYGILNIEQDPLAQGYSPNAYDIVLGVEVVHATADLEAALRNLQLLLRPHGALMLAEQVETAHYAKISFALLKGWWSFTDFRTKSYSPFCGGAEWMDLLRRTGYVDPHFIQINDDSDFGIIIGRSGAVAAEAPVQQHHSFGCALKTWMFYGPKCPLSLKLVERLARLGRTVEWATATTSQGNSDQVSLVTAEGGSDAKGPVEGVVCLYPDFESLHEMQRFRAKLENLVQSERGLASATTTFTESRRPKPKLIVLTRGVHHCVERNQKADNVSATVWRASSEWMNCCSSCCIIHLEQDVDTLAADEEIFSLLWETVPCTSGATVAEKLVFLRRDQRYVQQHRNMNPKLMESATRSAGFAKQDTKMGMGEETLTCGDRVQIQRFLEQVIKQTLGIAASSESWDIDPDHKFSEIGLDSLMLTEMRNQLLRGIQLAAHRNSDRTISIKAMEGDQTLRGLSIYIASLFNGEDD